MTRLDSWKSVATAFACALQAISPIVYSQDFKSADMAAWFNHHSDQDLVKLAKDIAQPIADRSIPVDLSKSDATIRSERSLDLVRQTQKRTQAKQVLQMAKDLEDAANGYPSLWKDNLLDHRQARTVIQILEQNQIEKIWPHLEAIMKLNQVLEDPRLSPQDRIQFVLDAHPSLSKYWRRLPSLMREFKRVDEIDIETLEEELKFYSDLKFNEFWLDDSYREPQNFDHQLWKEVTGVISPFLYQEELESKIDEELVEIKRDQKALEEQVFRTVVDQYESTIDFVAPYWSTRRINGQKYDVYYDSGFTQALDDPRIPRVRTVYSWSNFDDQEFALQLHFTRDEERWYTQGNRDQVRQDTARGKAFYNHTRWNDVIEWRPGIGFLTYPKIFTFGLHLCDDYDASSAMQTTVNQDSHRIKAKYRELHQKVIPTRQTLRARLIQGLQKII